MKRLLIPYIIWAFINSIYYIVLEDCSLYILPKMFFLKLFILPSPWFLLNLLLCDVSLFLSKRTTIKSYFIFIGYYCVWCVFFLITKLEIAKNMLLFYPYYIIGFYLPSYFKEKEMCVIKKGRSILITIYILSMFFYTHSSGSAYEKTMLIIKYVPVLSNSVDLIQSGLIFYSRYIVGILGIGFAYAVISYFNEYKYTKIINTQLHRIGTKTIYIYLISSLCEVSLFESRLINTIISLIAGVCIPLVISIIMKRFPKINKVMFG